jgi:hypothetical protein
MDSGTAVHSCGKNKFTRDGVGHHGARASTCCRGASNGSASVKRKI